PRRVLVLGGGDGLALREILKYPSVERVTLVDLDPEMTKLSTRFPPLAKLNQDSFNDPRVQVINEDAFIWVEDTSEAPYGKRRGVGAIHVADVRAQLLLVHHPHARSGGLFREAVLHGGAEFWVVG